MIFEHACQPNIVIVGEKWQMEALIIDLLMEEYLYTAIDFYRITRANLEVIREPQFIT